ncbi:hypothetical protein [Anaerovibrio sp.]|uniref:hypothetical protein n=1 Tax=Anaerovibrio sp. TaxID=1872532 RepID=UPI0025C41874|nr:hypothetical protein [Anaerovibrio sp.]MBR2143821.1 hypothetical protein [Anaerovibrio sp.]
MDTKTEAIKTNSETRMVRRIILNSENSTVIEEELRKLSKELMKKNEKLYRRLAYK